METVKKVKGLSIVSANEGFRRAGRAFGKTATVIPLKDLNKDEIALLKGESMLAISEVDIDVADDLPAEQKDKKTAE